ncbi:MULTISPECIES: ornithine carbamoyltransferase [Spiroplasma]|uniref:Ornithine carbamoyltransferase n=1 Tax=Spiroplasma eriocheiris TaxID=315358 RepID=A0A0H3XJ24_9MOLU|nr:ornithine carbamoyltransferase [Spiroplasma eriocheiris]AHF57326.1 ornithine carbamoyltransferase [Spiroplasma eriocheiris CCTCC M 207170]AKM53786.1 ornithine carbamoyltransferase [Spiroplasma eriocheiris]
MAVNLKGRSFLTLLDFTPREINYLLDLSRMLKEAKYAGTEQQPLKGKNVVLLFQKDSTRTRCAFEVAAADLGMNAVYLGPSGSQMGKKESIEDTAKVLGRMFDGIEFRGYKQSDVEDLAKYSGVPVWNGLTDLYHPTQMLADVLTIQEVKGPNVKGIKFVYFGDSRFNMANSYMIISAKLGMHFTACAPKDLWPDAKLLKQCQDIAKENGGSITLTEDHKTAAKDADVIATDVWVSMGEDKSVWKQRIADLTPYQVNMEKIKQAKEDVIFLHCLPSFHDENTDTAQDIIKEFGGNGELEVTNEVFTSKYSKVFEEAENRLHTIKAIMLATLRG